ncbi:hypothetical protein KKD03_05340 [Patescibacteria group bacterium]|nr:hypothetical protein [Patescibacteria group bacterium]
MISVSVGFNVKNKEILEKLKKVLFRAMIDMQKIAKQKCPVDTGRLRNSIKLFPSSPGAVKYILAATVEYAGDVEFGTAPHFVSSKELRDWAKRKLGDESAAGAVAEKIRRAGTNAQPFMRPALMQVKENKLKESFERILG